MIRYSETLRREHVPVLGNAQTQTCFGVRKRSDANMSLCLETLKCEHVSVFGNAKILLSSEMLKREHVSVFGGTEHFKEVPILFKRDDTSSSSGPSVWSKKHLLELNPFNAFTLISTKPKGPNEAVRDCTKSHDFVQESHAIQLRRHTLITV